VLRQESPASSISQAVQCLGPIFCAKPSVNATSRSIIEANLFTAGSRCFHDVARLLLFFRLRAPTTCCFPVPIQTHATGQRIPACSCETTHPPTSSPDLLRLSIPNFRIDNTCTASVCLEEIRDRPVRRLLRREG
jgi:hypothetical protein